MIDNHNQFVELLCSNDTERVRAVTKRTAPCTHCPRRLAAKFQFIEQIGIQQAYNFVINPDIR